jgi:hypothetical protein
MKRLVFLAVVLLFIIIVPVLAQTGTVNVVINTYVPFKLDVRFADADKIANSRPNDSEGAVFNDAVRCDVRWSKNGSQWTLSKGLDKWFNATGALMQEYRIIFETNSSDVWRIDFYVNYSEPLTTHMMYSAIGGDGEYMVGVSNATLSLDERQEFHAHFDLTTTQLLRLPVSTTEGLVSYLVLPLAGLLAAVCIFVIIGVKRRWIVFEKETPSEMAG